MTDWSECIAQVAPQVVRIQTAARSGTGFIHYGTDGGPRGIVTARHVIESFPGDHRPLLVVHGATVFRYGMPDSKDALDAISWAVPRSFNICASKNKMLAFSPNALFQDPDMREIIQTANGIECKRVQMHGHIVKYVWFRYVIGVWEHLKCFHDASCHDPQTPA